jgi:hypothetical protein
MVDNNVNTVSVKQIYLYAAAQLTIGGRDTLGD